MWLVFLQEPEVPGTGTGTQGNNVGNNITHHQFSCIFSLNLKVKNLKRRKKKSMMN